MTLLKVFLKLSTSLYGMRDLTFMGECHSLDSHLMETELIVVIVSVVWNGVELNEQLALRCFILYADFTLPHWE